MCWLSKEFVRPQVAEGDIKVIKLLGKSESGTFHAPIYPFTYEFGKVYTEPAFEGPVLAEGKMWYNGMYKIEDAFHTFSPDCRMCDEDIWMNSMHLDTDDRCELCDMCICLAVIPKGATYCLNDNGEYASDKIRIDKVLNFIEDFGINDLTDEDEDEFADTFREYYKL